MTYRVGLTGGIASGKSAAAALFSELDVPVIDSDVIARLVVAPGTDGLAAVVARFGPDILTADGNLDRRALRRRVFADPAERKALEALLHPRIAAHMLQCSESAGGPYQIWVIPLLVESGWTERVDRVLVVDCPRETQIVRLVARDGGTREEAERIIDAQAPAAERRAAADDVLENDGTFEALAARVYELHQSYLALATAAAS